MRMIRSSRAWTSILILAAGLAPAIASSPYNGNITGAGATGLMPQTVTITTAAGGAATAYPIPVPPGRAGLEPDLTLSYNSSSSAVGIVGRGWSFGFPQVQRSTRRGRPKFDWTDRFVLSIGGQSYDMTMLTDNGTGIREFRTDIQTFWRVRSYSIGGGLTYWEAEDGRGTTYQMGKDGGTGAWAQVGDFIWALNRVQDAHGNYLRMDWTINAGVLYPATIVYTGNDGSTPAQTPTNKVEFAYEGRYDTSVSMMGVRSDLLQRLRSITTRVDGQPVNIYTLEYTTPSTSTPPANSNWFNAQDQQSLLNKITRYDSAQQAHLPATFFNYVDDSRAGWWSPQTITIPELILKKDCTAQGRKVDDLGVQIEDLNRDGLPELVRGYSCRRNETTYCGTARFTYVNSNGTWPTQPDAAWALPDDFVVHRFGGEEYDNGMRMLDINGDGLPDLVRSVMTLSDPQVCTFNQHVYKVWINNGHGWSLNTSWTVPIPFIQFNFLCPNQDADIGVRFADVNGDGLVDIVAARNNYSVRGVWLNNGVNGWSFQSSWTVPEDFVFHFPGGESIDPGTRLVDVNGDGMADLVKSASWNGGPTQSVVHFSDGKSFVLQNDWTIPEPIMAVSTSNDSSLDLGFRFADVNADGRLDIVVGNPSRRTVYLARASKGWAEDPVRSQAVLPTIVEFNDGRTWDEGIRVTDLNGDGAADFVRSIDWCGTIFKTNQANVSVFENILSQAHVGFIQDYADLSYTPSTRFVNKLDGAAATDPSNMGFPMPLLTSVTHHQLVFGTAEFDYTYVTTYSYRGGYFHYPQREFRGFRYVRVNPPGGTSYQETLYVQDTALAIAPLAGAIERTAIRKTSDNTVFTLQVNAYDRSDGLWPFFHYLQASDSYLYDFLAGSNGAIETLAPPATLNKVRTVHSYQFEPGPASNAFVRVHDTQVLGDATNNNVRSDDDAYFRDEFKNDTAQWRLGYLWHRQTTDAATGGARLADTWLYYDHLALASVGPKGDLTRTEAWSGQPGDGPGAIANRNTTMDYDVFGNQTTLTDQLGHTMTTQFGLSDPTHTFPNMMRVDTDRSGSPLHHDILIQYDRRFGVRTSVASQARGTFNFEYDGFGRTKKIWSGLDTQALPTACLTYDDDPGSSTPRSVSTYLREVSGLGDECGPGQMQASTSFYDGLGRLVEVKSEGAGDVPEHYSRVVRLQSYDAAGRLKTSRVPYHSGQAYSTFVLPSTSVSTTYTYDAVGREFKVTQSGAPPNTKTYSGWKTINTDPESKITESDRDAFGRTTQVRSFDSTGALYTRTSMTYDRLGRLRFVTDIRNNSIEYRYDAFGELVKTIDPDAGTVDREYYADGMLKKITDDRNQPSTLLYDAMHRVVTMARTDGSSVSYRYDEASGRPGGTEPIDLLTSTEDSATGIREEFEYDAIGRRVKSRQRIGPRVYEMATSLDDLGRVTRLTYPDNASVDYYYGNDGFVRSIHGWLTGYAAPTYTASGKLSTLLDGAGQLTNTYSTTTDRLTNQKITTGSLITPTTLYDVTYTYSPAGYLQGMTDTVGTDSHTFTLDQLYRLTSATGTYGRTCQGACPSLTYAYDNVNNLTSKEGVIFTYGDVLHPHQMTSNGSGTSFAYDAIGGLRSALQNGVGRCFDYNLDGRLSAVRSTQSGCNPGDPQPASITSYSYDPEGRKVGQIDSQGGVSTSTTFIKDYYEERGTFTRKYIFLDGVRIAAWDNDGTVHYFMSGLTRNVVYANSSQVDTQQRLEYKPYGEISSSISGHPVPSYLFAGSRRDLATGLYDFGARFYDPALGRFLTVDPVPGSPGEPAGLNPYGYALGNPATFYDANGMFPWRDVAAFAVGAGVTIATHGCFQCGAVAAGAVGGGLQAHKAGGDVFAGAVQGAVIAGVASGITQDISPAIHIANAYGRAAALGAINGLIAGSLEAGVNGGSAGDVLKGAAADAAMAAAMAKVPLPKSWNKGVAQLADASQAQASCGPSTIGSDAGPSPIWPITALREYMRVNGYGSLNWAGLLFFRINRTPPPIRGSLKVTEVTPRLGNWFGEIPEGAYGPNNPPIPDQLHRALSHAEVPPEPLPEGRHVGLLEGIALHGMEVMIIIMPVPEPIMRMQLGMPCGPYPCPGPI